MTEATAWTTDQFPDINWNEWDEYVDAKGNVVHGIYINTKQDEMMCGECGLSMVYPVRENGKKTIYSMNGHINGTHKRQDRANMEYAMQQMNEFTREQNLLTDLQNLREWVTKMFQAEELAHRTHQEINDLSDVLEEAHREIREYRGYIEDVLSTIRMEEEK